MEEKISLYRDAPSPVIVYHNKNERPHVDVPHLHSQYEIYYNIDGAKGFFADKRFYDCTGFDLFAIPQACVHKVIVSRGAVYERCIINIDTKIIDAINAAPHMNRPLSWLTGSPFPKKANLNEQEHEEFMNLIKQYHAQESHELKRYAALIGILAFIGGFFLPGRMASPAGSPPDSIAEKALVLIEDQFQDIKISEIAETLFVNESYFSKLFKEEFGLTPENYLIVRKIAEAKKYLYMGASVKEACFLSGFHNYSNFIRTFKNFEGYSPGNLEKLTDPL